MLRGPESARDLEAALPDLQKAGLNVLVTEVNYNFAFQSHPELREKNVLTADQASHLANACRAHGIRLIPQFNCLGHQSWAGSTFPLLTHYPAFDETPGQYPGNKDIYCRSWCPQHPDVNRVAFSLMDEIAGAFLADAMHVGLDEVFLIASEHCPRCKGGDPAKLFAKAVRDYHRHLVGIRKLEMLMWGDRLLDGNALGFGKWEAATNGTQGAVDELPRDIIICDWHYEPLGSYPGKPADYTSIAFLLEKGFRVWPSGWKNVDASAALARSALAKKDPAILGHLCTTWGAVKIRELPQWPPLKAAFDVWQTPKSLEEAGNEPSK